MALGKPVVATDIPGTHQVLNESLWPECLAAPLDAQALAQRMLALLTNAELSETIGTRNRQRIEQHFSIEGMCAFFLALLEQHAATGTSRHA